jgi:NADH:ubiquinone oxidoreductase subunit 6 (subunit J)
VSLDRRDRHRSITVVATALGLMGLVAAALMAVVGLPPVDLHGPLHYVGIMDPLCGGTRAARLTAQGHLAEAWTYNPLGILATLGAVAVVVRTTVGLATHRWLNLHGRLTPRQARLLIAVVLILTILLEVRQQQHADLLASGL